MGFIADLASDAKAGTGRELWDRVFGATTKEDGHKQPATRDHNSHTRSATGEASLKRLLTALRSKAPGGWTDDRFEQSKAFTSIVYVAGHRKYEQMAQAEFQVFQEDDLEPDGKRPVRRGEPGWDLVQLLKRPNPEDSFGDLLYAWSQQMDLTGSALTWKVPNAHGIPYELYPLHTATAVPQATMNPEYPHGFYRIQPLYPYGPFSSSPTPFSAVGAPVPAEWVMRMKFPHPLLRYEGWSPLTALRLENDELTSISRSRWYKMKRSVNPSAVLNFDGVDGMEPLPEEEIDRLVAILEAGLQGTENHGNLLVAPPGGKLEEWGRSPLDMDYPAGWEQLVSFIMAGLGITKPAAGMIEDASYASLFATLKQLHLLTLKPMADRFAARLTRDLAGYFGDGLIVEIRCPRIDDHEVKGMKIDRLMAGKAITKNELRKELDMPLTTEEWGEDIAGDPSPKEQEQQQEQQEQQMEMAQAKGDDGGSDPNAFDAAGGQEGAADGMESAAGGKLDEQKIAAGQPKTGTLGRGALGPRKSLKDLRRAAAKKLRAKYGHLAAPVNGNGRH